MQPPKNAIAFLRWFCREDYLDEIEGDLIEVFNKESKHSERGASWKFRWRVIKYFRPEFLKPLKNFQPNYNGMFKNYLKIGWRNLVRDKAYSTINIVSLAAGLTVALLIGIWTWDELSFNAQFANHERLAQIMVNQSHEELTQTDETIAPPIAEPLRKQFPDEISRQSLMSYEGGRTLQWNNVKLNGNGAWVQKDFAEMFTLEMKSGSRRALEDPSHMLLSASQAKAIFGDVDPVGKLVRVDDHFDMTVGGVYEDFARNSSFSGLKVLLPWDHQDNWLNKVTDWNNHSCKLYLQMARGVDAESLTSKIRNIPTPHVEVIKEELLVHPFDKIRFMTNLRMANPPGATLKL